MTKRYRVLKLLMLLVLQIVVWCHADANSVNSEAHWVPVSVKDTVRVLGSDARPIIDYVRHEFDHEPVAGYRKPPWLTIAQRAGNDWELAALLVALLREAGYEARFVTGFVEMPVHTAEAWLNAHLSEWDLALLDPEEIPMNEAEVCVSFFNQLGKPATFRETPNGYLLRAEHVWVKVRIGDTWHMVDPSFKLYEYEACIDLGTALDYDEFSLMRATKRGARIRSDSVQKLNAEILESSLAEYASALQQYLEDTSPEATVSDIVGKWTRVVDRETASGISFESELIAERELDAVPEAEWYLFDVSIPELGWETTLRLHEISGKPLAIHTDYSTVTVAIDGNRIFEIEPDPGVRTYTLTVTSRTPTGSIDTRERPLVRGETYVLSLIAGGDPSAILSTRRMLLEHVLLEDSAKTPDLALGTPEPEGYELRTPVDEEEEAASEYSLPVICESLHVMGLSYLDETWRIVHDVMAPMFEVRVAPTYRCTFNSTVNGYQFDLWFDPGLTYWRGGSSSVRAKAFDRLMGHTQSAVEHAHIEQLQGRKAVSAISGLAAANAQGLVVYRVDDDNWAEILPELSLSDPVKEHLRGVFEQGELGPDAYAILPDGDVRIGDWEGAVFIADGHVVWTQTKIDGGVIATPGFDILSVPADTTVTPHAGVSLPESGISVDLKSGALRHKVTDLVFVGEAPGGLPPLQRRYVGLGSEATTIGLGWQHSYDIAVHTVSGWSHLAANDRALNAAQVIVAVYIAGGLLEFGESSRSLDRAMRAVLIVQWMFDQLLSNAATLTGLEDSPLVFNRDADGDYKCNACGELALSQDKSGGWQLRGPGEVHLAFGPDGRLLSWASADGRCLSFDYDMGVLTSVVTELGEEVALSYDDGKVARIKDWTGRAVTYEYDSDGFLVRAVTPVGDSQYAYDEKRRLTECGPSLGIAKTHIGYDALGRVTVLRTSSGRETQYTYAGDRVLVVDPRGAETRYGVDQDDHIASVLDSNGNVSSKQFDSRGMLICESDALGNSTLYEYNEAGALVGIRYPDGMTAAFDYDALYRITDAVDRDGGTAQFAYDSVGHLSSFVDPLNRTTHLEYDARGNLVRITEQDGATTHIGYTDMGRVASLTDAEGRIWHLKTDALGRVTGIADPNHAEWLLSWTEWGSLAQIIDPLGQSISHSYDQLGLLRSITDATGHTDSFSYGEDGELVSMSRADQVLVQYAYDEGGAVEAVVDANGNRTLVMRDLLGRMTHVIDALKRDTGFAYDAVGRVTGMTGPDGHETRYARDAVGRVTGVTYGSADSALFSYDEVGRVLNTARRDWRAEYTYDQGGRVVAIAYPSVDVELRYTYSSLDVPDALVLVCRGEEAASFSYAYNSMQELVEIRDASGLHTLRRNEAGRVAGIDYSNGAGTAIEYDQAARIIEVASCDAAGELLFSESYTYDAAGNVKEITRSGAANRAVCSFTYDVHHRLIGETTPLSSRGYAYDGAGNRIQLVSGTTQTNYAYNASNEITRDGSWPFAHSSSGNVTQITTEGGEWHLQFTDDERLSSLRSPSGDIDQFVYDAFGRLVSWTMHGQNPVWFIHDAAGNLLAELDTDGLLQRLYTMAAGIPLLREDADGAGSSFVWYHCDRLGSVRSLSGSDGDLVSEFSYTAFGELQEGSAESTGSLSFAATSGALRVPSMPGLYLIGGRPYLARLGRFLTKDEIWIELLMGGCFNPYTYAMSNPLKYVDPSGRFPQLGGVMADGEGWIDPLFLSKSTMEENLLKEAQQLSSFKPVPDVTKYYVQRGIIALPDIPQPVEDFILDSFWRPVGVMRRLGGLVGGPVVGEAASRLGEFFLQAFEEGYLELPDRRWR